MVDFDEDGWFVGQKVKIKVNHENDHGRLYPKPKTVSGYDKSKYTIHDHTTHKNYVEEEFQVVPLYETKYRGKKYQKWNKKCSGALAIISKSTKSNKMLIIKILIPK